MSDTGEGVAATGRPTGTTPDDFCPTCGAAKTPTTCGCESPGERIVRNYREARDRYEQADKVKHPRGVQQVGKSEAAHYFDGAAFGFRQAALILGVAPEVLDAV